MNEETELNDSGESARLQIVDHVVGHVVAIDAVTTTGHCDVEYHQPGVGHDHCLWKFRLIFHVVLKVGESAGT